MARDVMMQKDARAKEAWDAQRAPVAWYVWFLQHPEVVGKELPDKMWAVRTRYERNDHPNSEC